jgi:hypothetical protein
MGDDEHRIFLERIEAWLHEKPTRGRRALDRYLGFWHSLRAPRFSLLGISHWLARISLVCAAPAIFALVYRSITLHQAAVAGSVLLILTVLSEALGGVRERRRQTARLESEEMWVHINDLLASLDVNHGGESSGDKALSSYLGLLEGYARQVLRAKDGDVSASLVLYTSSSREQMLIENRNKGNRRPVNRTVEDPEMMVGHHVCAAGLRPRFVNDIRRFGPGAKSPTQAEPSYRSILFMPLAGTGDAKDTCLGFVSVDARRPYAFYGTRWSKIVMTCVPIMGHIREQVTARSVAASKGG